MPRNLLNRMRTYFFTGLAVVLPAFLTVIILKWLLGKLSQWFLEPFVKWIRPYVDSFLLIFLIKATLFLLIIIVIIVIGAAARIIILRKLFGWGERFFLRVPFINKIYTTTKEVSMALFGGKKGLFRKVVAIEYPRIGVFSIGFVTCDHIDRKAVKRPLEEDLVSVFVPTSPTPASGFFVIVKKSDIIEIDMTVEEALKLIISGGAIFPYTKKGKTT